MATRKLHSGLKQKVSSSGSEIWKLYISARNVHGSDLNWFWVITTMVLMPTRGLMHLTGPKKFFVEAMVVPVFGVLGRMERSRIFSDFFPFTKSCQYSNW